MVFMPPGSAKIISPSSYAPAWELQSRRRFACTGEAQMEANPVAFMTLVGKVLPLQVSGEGGGPMIIKLIKYGRD